jgi:hypothetical protein
LIGDELCNRAFLIASETNMDPSSSCWYYVLQWLARIGGKYWRYAAYSLI